MYQQENLFQMMQFIPLRTECHSRGRIAIKLLLESHCAGIHETVYHCVLAVPRSGIKILDSIHITWLIAVAHEPVQWRYTNQEVILCKIKIMIQQQVYVVIEAESRSSVIAH